MRVVSLIKSSSLVCVASVSLGLACNSSGGQMAAATTTAGAPSTAAPTAPVAAPSAAAGSMATTGPAAAAGGTATTITAAAGSSAAAAAGSTGAVTAAAGSSAGPAAGSGAPAAGGGMGWNEIYDSVIVDSGCVGGGACHQSSAGNSKLGLADPMMAYTELLNVAAMGMNLPGGMMPAPPNCAGTGTMRVKPGDPDNSLLMQKLEGKQKCGIAMPPGGPLDAPKLSAVRAWIMAGAKP